MLFSLNFRYNTILNNSEFMNYKLLKLNIKISLMKIFTSSKIQRKVTNFTAEKIRYPNILVIFPVEDDLIEEAMDCMSKVVSAHESNGSNFSFIIGKDAVSKVSFFNIWAKSFSINVIPIAITKGKYIINSHKSIDKLKFKIFDIVINLNITFNPDIDMFIDKLKAEYKIGFVSKYSDLFYNIQVNWDGSKSRFKPIINMLG